MQVNINIDDICALLSEDKEDRQVVVNYIVRSFMREQDSQILLLLSQLESLRNKLSKYESVIEPLPNIQE